MQSNQSFQSRPIKSPVCYFSLGPDVEDKRVQNELLFLNSGYIARLHPKITFQLPISFKKCLVCWFVFHMFCQLPFLIDLSSIIFHRLSLQLNFAQPGWTEIATCLSQSLPELLSQAAGNQDILPLPAVNFYFLPETFDYTGTESYLTSPPFYRSECVAAWFCERKRKFGTSHCAEWRWRD